VPHDVRRTSPLHLFRQSQTIDAKRETPSSVWPESTVVVDFGHTPPKTAQFSIGFGST
jgi:hypothetical protein